MSATLDRYRRQAVLLDEPASPLVPGLDDVLELADRELPGWKPRQARTLRNGQPVAGEDKWYVDSKPPFNTADFTTVTLLTTSLQLWPAALYTPTAGAPYWWPGKEMRLRSMGKITTAATPGNLTIEVRYATTDAGGTILATSAATAMAASKTNISWDIDIYIECRAIGSGTNGSLFAWGKFSFDGAGGLFTTAANQPLFIPGTAAAAVGVDTVAASGISLQFKRSGSTVETVTAQDCLWQSLN